MIMQSLNIGLKNPYSPPSEKNQYEAKLSVKYGENSMQVSLSPEACHKILSLAGDEIAAAAQIQIADFVRTAIAVSTMPMIEAEANASDDIGF